LEAEGDDPVVWSVLQTLVLPALMFFFAQRQFMQGVVMTGVEK